VVTSFTTTPCPVLLTKVAGQTVGNVTYDALGRSAIETNPSVTVTNTYDSMGRVTRRTCGQYHEDSPTVAAGCHTPDRGRPHTSYTYDALGRRASETKPNEETINYEYNLAAR